MTEFNQLDTDVIDALRDVNRGFKFDDGSVLVMRKDNRSLLILYDPIVSVGMPEAAGYLCDLVTNATEKLQERRRQ